MTCKLLSHRRRKFVEEFDQRRPESYEYQGKQREDNQGDDHFGRGFGCGFLGPATAFGAQRIGVKTKRLRNAGPEAIGLH